jgi:signal transduction histidine kinase
MRGLAVVLEETRVLSRLIEDLRTLALSEAGALRLEKEPTDVAALAREGGDGALGRRCCTEVSIEVRDDAHTSIAIDPFRIREVLTNVIANAVRHSTAGGIVTVAVTAAPQGEAATGVVVAIIDTGAGMTPDKRHGCSIVSTRTRSRVVPAWASPSHGAWSPRTAAPSASTARLRAAPRSRLPLPGDQPSLTA